MLDKKDLEIILNDIHTLINQQIIPDLEEKIKFIIIDEIIKRSISIKSSEYCCPRMKEVRLQVMENLGHRITWNFCAFCGAKL